MAMQGKGVREAYRVCPSSCGHKWYRQELKVSLPVQFPSSLSGPLLNTNKQIASTQTAPPGQKTLNGWSPSSISLSTVSDESLIVQQEEDTLAVKQLNTTKQKEK